MGHADNPAGTVGQSDPRPFPESPGSAELVIIGGGIMGLWAALKADRLGVSTVLVDAGRPGQGASGGLLGALMPHMPDRWNDKKQFQYDALVSLEDEIAEIEAATGLACGYRRCGRLIPLPQAHLRPIALRHSKDAEAHWHRHGRRFHWHVTDRPADEGWPEESFCGAGLVHDTLAARVSPRRLVSALVAALRTSSRVRILKGQEVARIDPDGNRVIFRSGGTLAYGHCIVAAGSASFPLLEELSQPLRRPLGQPVKGQAALLAARMEAAMPIIYLNGLYVIAHEDGHVAVGSTSENSFDDPVSTDSQLDLLVDRARELVPGLGDAPVVERWAGLRPKAVGRDPLVGPHPDHPRVIALTGGFKVSFGLAHRLADAALAGLGASKIQLPSSFGFQDHLAAASS